MHKISLFESSLMHICREKHFEDHVSGECDEALISNTISFDAVDQSM